MEAIDQDSLPAFLNSLRKDPRCKDWQIRQAENAVRLFVVNFLNLDIRPKKPADLGTGEEVKALPWDEAFKKMVESLRVRHYSYKTERTYMDWMVRFIESPLDRLERVAICEIRSSVVQKLDGGRSRAEPRLSLAQPSTERNRVSEECPSALTAVLSV